jgi:hypothetical protein
MPQFFTPDYGLDGAAIRLTVMENAEFFSKCELAHISRHIPELCYRIMGV